MRGEATEMRVAILVLCALTITGSCWSEEAISRPVTVLNIGGPPLTPTRAIGRSATVHNIHNDCDESGFPDDIDIAEGLADDANGNLVIDTCEIPFIRSDANVDGAVDLGDVMAVLDYLFGGLPAPPCLEALDAANDGGVGISDAFLILHRLFASGASLPPIEPTGCGLPGSGPFDPGPFYLGCEVSDCSP